MRSPVLICFFQNFILIIDFSYCRDSKTSEMRLQQQRLGFIVRDTADPQISFQFLHIPFKFRTERRILYIVDRTIKAFLTVDCHSSSSRSEMGMIIHSIKKLKHTVVFRCNAKKTAHFISSLKTSHVINNDAQQRQDSLCCPAVLTAYQYSPH